MHTPQLFKNAWMPGFVNSFDKIFQDNFGNWNSDSPIFVPRCDILETDSRFEIHLAAPGMTKDAFKLEVRDNVLTVEGERKTQSEENNARYRRIEQKYGKFARSFTLDAHVRTQEITAEYTNGVLKVVIPKSEPQVQTRAIEIA